MGKWVQTAREDSPVGYQEVFLDHKGGSTVGQIAEGVVDFKLGVGCYLLGKLRARSC